MTAATWSAACCAVADFLTRDGSAQVCVQFQSPKHFCAPPTRYAFCERTGMTVESSSTAAAARRYRQVERVLESQGHGLGRLMHVLYVYLLDRVGRDYAHRVLRACDVAPNASDVEDLAI